jgi:hypothetical protein
MPSLEDGLHRLRDGVVGGCAGQGQPQHALARQAGLAAAVGEPVVPYAVDPSLEEGGHALPVHREDGDDDIGVQDPPHVGVRLVRVRLLPVAPLRLVLHVHPRVEPLGVQVEQVDAVSGGLELGSRAAGGVGGEGIAAVVRDDHEGCPGVTAVLRHGVSRGLDLCGESSTTAAP